jgi:hypothetical protein
VVVVVSISSLSASAIFDRYYRRKKRYLNEYIDVYVCCLFESMDQKECMDDGGN